MSLSLPIWDAAARRGALPLYPAGGLGYGGLPMTHLRFTGGSAPLSPGPIRLQVTRERL